MQPESYMSVCAVDQPDARVESDDLCSPHQYDVHDDRQSLMLSWRVHVIAVLAHHTHCNILKRAQTSGDAEA